MERKLKPAVRLTDTVQVGRIETLEDVLRLLSSLEDISPAHKSLYGDGDASASPSLKRAALRTALAGITQFRVNEAIRKQKTKQEPKGRIMP